MPDQVSNLSDYQPKIWAWSSELHGIMGKRFSSIDLDVVILDDLATVLNSSSPVIIWDSAKNEPYNTSLFSVEPGFGNQVWDLLTPKKIKAASESANYWTGDQSWVAHILGPNIETFGEASGVVRYRPSLHSAGLPLGTKAAFFCGPYCPKTERENSGWIGRHWN